MGTRCAFCAQLVKKLTVRLQIGTACRIVLVLSGFSGNGIYSDPIPTRLVPTAEPRNRPFRERGHVRNALSKPLTKQFSKFAVVGILSFALDWLLLVLFVETFHMNYMLATSLSFLASVALNYALSMRFVFDHRDDMSRKREFTIFAILSAIGLALTDVFMFVGVTVLNIAYQLMKVIATFCVTWYNFLSRKKFLAGSTN